MRGLGRDEHGGSGSITEKRHRRRISLIYPPRQDIRGNHEHRFAGTLAIGVRKNERIDEARARGRQVGRPSLNKTQPVRDQGSSGRKQVIGCAGREKKKTNFICLDARFLESFRACAYGEIRSRFAG